MDQRPSLAVEEIDLAHLSRTSDPEAELFRGTRAAPRLPEPLTGDSVARRLHFRDRVGRRDRGRTPDAQVPPSPQDPFATLLAPLGEMEYHALQTRVQREVPVLYERMRAQQRAQVTNARWGGLVGLVVLAALAGPRVGQVLLDVRDTSPPSLLTDTARLDVDQARMALMVFIGLVGMWAIGLSMVAGERLLEVARRRWASIVPALAAGAAAAGAAWSLAGGRYVLAGVCVLAGSVMVGLSGRVLRSLGLR